jgi:hypothetical protein
MNGPQQSNLFKLRRHIRTGRDNLPAAPHPCFLLRWCGRVEGEKPGQPASSQMFETQRLVRAVIVETVSGIVMNTKVVDQDDGIKALP